MVFWWFSRKPSASSSRPPSSNPGLVCPAPQVPPGYMWTEDGYQWSLVETPKNPGKWVGFPVGMDDHPFVLFFFGEGRMKFSPNLWMKKYADLKRGGGVCSKKIDSSEKVLVSSVVVRLEDFLNIPSGKYRMHGFQSWNDPWIEVFFFLTNFHSAFIINQQEVFCICI